MVTPGFEPGLVERSANKIIRIHSDNLYTTQPRFSRKRACAHYTQKRLSGLTTKLPRKAVIKCKASFYLNILIMIGNRKAYLYDIDSIYIPLNF